MGNLLSSERRPTFSLPRRRFGFQVYFSFIYMSYGYNIISSNANFWVLINYLFRVSQDCFSRCIILPSEITIILHMNKGQISNFCCTLDNYLCWKIRRLFMIILGQIKISLYANSDFAILSAFGGMQNTTVYRGALQTAFQLHFLTHKPCILRKRIIPE